MTVRYFPIMNKLFFFLIQVSVGVRDRLIVKPTAQQWALLYEMVEKQLLVAICFQGVQRIYEEYSEQTVILSIDMRM